MASPRCAGPLAVTSSPSSRITPEVVSSSPAISRSKVDLPQPEGPTKTTKAPSSISRLTSGMTAWLPKVLLTCSRLIEPMACPLFDGAEGESAHQLLLAQPAQYQDGGDGERRGGGELGPEQALRRREAGDERRQRRRLGGGEV